MSLNIFSSNRMEHLVEVLSRITQQPLASVLEPEVIVVQSKGMQHWLAMKLAGTFGVWANCSYPFPNAMIWQLFRAVLPDPPDISAFTPEVMTWKIMGMLPGLLERREFASLKHYLEGDRNGLKLFQLSRKISDTFDQYTLYRPELLQEWEQGGGRDWQAILWNRLAASGGGRHRGTMKLDFSHLVATGGSAGCRFPERISVFGISYLPQYHLDILSDAGRHTEVNLLLLSPCREYWGDIIAPKDLARRDPSLRDLAVEGNPLLASLGRLGRDFSNMVTGRDGVVASEFDLYEDPGTDTLLAALQSDILNLRAAGAHRRPIAPEDRSVQIHSCHSPLREMEVLHDNLLMLLEQAPGLAPRDIVVMTPDIEAYAPYIAMVFDGIRDPATKIPYSVADRSLARDGMIAGIVGRLLELPGGRLTVTAVFDILETEPVRKRFGLGPEDIDTIRGWLEETRIRWGIDERHRGRLGLPPYRDNSWQAGLDRLLLGYAMPEEGGRLFNGLLPFDEMEGDQAQVLGRFATFIENIIDLADRLAGERTLGEWRAALHAVLRDFIEADDSTAHELAALSGMVEDLEKQGAIAGFTGNVDRTVVSSWFTSCLTGEGHSHGFITGGVTFCAMLPMRSIPFRVVALVGMNDASFPRHGRPPGFDLIARNPRPGDRSLRDEDRYLFLECLLSARQYFYISYVGQSVKDNGVIPPSVLVSELLDAVRGGFSAGEMPLEQRLVTHHRLQPFSRSYFDGSTRHFSYDRENCAALLEARRAPPLPRSFMTTPLKEPPPEMRDVTLTQLLRFFVNPAEYFIRNRLEIRLDDVSPPLEDREIFEVEGLEAYSLHQKLFDIRMQGGGVEDFFESIRCRGVLPPGRHGRVLFEAAADESGRFADRIREELSGRERLAPLDFEVIRGDFRISGRLDGIWTERKIVCRCSRMKAKDQIRAWIEHLLLTITASEAYPRESLLIMTDAAVTFKPVDNAAGILDTLLESYWHGLRVPLRFFPATSLELVSSGGDVERARKCWESGDWNRGEDEDPSFRLCFGQESDPLTDEFVRTAQSLLGPLVGHRASGWGGL